MVTITKVVSVNEVTAKVKSLNVIYILMTYQGICTK